MRDIIIFALGTLFGVLLLTVISAIVIQWSMRKDAVKDETEE